MPYCEPHRTARARIVDREILKLELRKDSHAPTRLSNGKARTNDHRATSPRQVA